MQVETSSSFSPTREELLAATLAEMASAEPEGGPLVDLSSYDVLDHNADHTIAWEITWKTSQR
ncbi:uncharacterized protein SOCE26_100480 [Sorangium cellulosum]|uniref:Uncharacterized protein n=1 Tax=Sorangium cellulosum TaxID=56 RepID=A0A2L0FAA9_SORCE|nr:hypothetical protein [Sorangium cellulosum]AUX48510.1 uncharacterized protein SOCE26_100480 [Sorangium cellulosum]